MRYLWYHCTAYFYILSGMNILLLYVIRLIVFHTPQKEHIFIFCACICFCYAGFLPLILIYNIRCYRKRFFGKFFDVVSFWKSFCWVTRLICSFLIPLLGKTWKLICHYIFIARDIFYFRAILLEYKSPYQYYICIKNF